MSETLSIIALNIIHLPFTISLNLNGIKSISVSEPYALLIGDVGTEFKQAQLLQHAGELANAGGFKLYDRFYFHPSKSGKRDLIEDKNIPFAQEFYGSHKYGDEETMTENNPDWIQPELLDEVVINVSKKDIEEKEKKSPGSTRFEVLKNRQ